MFQFHIGAIRIGIRRAHLAGYTGFQFHIGAIRIDQSSQVQTEQACFNSILVQLESHSTRECDGFIKVSIPYWCNQNLFFCRRLCAFVVVSIPYWCNQNFVDRVLLKRTGAFQFHIGAIRITLRTFRCIVLARFQFHIGAIRIYYTSWYICSYNWFQFHIGAIRIDLRLRDLRRLKGFNSILVQLELPSSTGKEIPN